jgi:hypothetical protein
MIVDPGPAATVLGVTVSVTGCGDGSNQAVSGNPTKPLHLSEPNRRVRRTCDAAAIARQSTKPSRTGLSKEPCVCRPWAMPGRRPVLPRQAHPRVLEDEHQEARLPRGETERLDGRH